MESVQVKVLFGFHKEDLINGATLEDCYKDLNKIEYEEALSLYADLPLMWKELVRPCFFSLDSQARQDFLNFVDFVTGDEGKNWKEKFFSLLCRIQKRVQCLFDITVLLNEASVDSSRFNLERFNCIFNSMKRALLRDEWVVFACHNFFLCDVLHRFSDISDKSYVDMSNRMFEVLGCSFRASDIYNLKDFMLEEFFIKLGFLSPTVVRFLKDNLSRGIVYEDLGEIKKGLATFNPTVYCFSCDICQCCVIPVMNLSFELDTD